MSHRETSARGRRGYRQREGCIQAGLARTVRGKFLALREEDSTQAAKYLGASEMRIIIRHMVPSFSSHLIAAFLLRVPEMILAETSLGFLGLGLREPVISWACC